MAKRSELAKVVHAVRHLAEQGKRFTLIRSKNFPTIDDETWETVLIGVYFGTNHRDFIDRTENDDDVVSPQAG